MRQKTDVEAVAGPCKKHRRSRAAIARRADFDFGSPAQICKISQTLSQALADGPWD